jgi:hypothetical protein
LEFPAIAIKTKGEPAEGANLETLTGLLPRDLGRDTPDDATEDFPVS